MSTLAIRHNALTRYRDVKQDTELSTDIVDYAAIASGLGSTTSVPIT